ncbi:MAG: fused MFS/spermidine synthase, partial [Pseudomonadales bacterium]|nr:fused MFS/spermidine synthase [Pseudomonadales bacterium]
KNLHLVGVGGGARPVNVKMLCPRSQFDVGGINVVYVRVAREYFDLKETPSMKVIVADARVFSKRAWLKDMTYDLVILDAFTGDYIPEHLMTREFLDEVKRILEPGGAVVANTFSTSKLYDHESVTYHDVFGDFLNFKMPITGNRVIIATDGKLPGDEVIEERAAHFPPLLDRYGVEIEIYPRFLSRDPDWDQDKRPLTDQYSPANLLK